MSDLSPKAKAIMDVFDNEYYHKAKLRQVAIAATLRELVNQLKYIGITEKNILEMTEKELIEIQIAHLQGQIKEKQKKLEKMEKTKSPVEEAYKRWMGNYPPTGPSVDGIDDIRWRAFQMGYNAAYEEKVAQEPEENEWKSVALRFGEKLSGYLSDGYYELSPAAWFRWAVFTYGKGQQIKNAVRESVKWCEEHPEKSVEDYLTLS